MSLALRVGVPLNNKCSKKCDVPAMWSGSSREPTSNQKPTETERTSDIRSVTTVAPESSVVRRNLTKVRPRSQMRAARARVEVLRRDVRGRGPLCDHDCGLRRAEAFALLTQQLKHAPPRSSFPAPSGARA